mgnify:CR=1 FL=1
MKALIVAILALMLFTADTQARRQAPCLFYFDFETWQLVPYYPPPVASTNTVSFALQEKTAWQKFLAAVDRIDALDSTRGVRIVLLVALAFLCDEIRLRRKRLGKI